MNITGIAKATPQLQAGGSISHAIPGFADLVMIKKKGRGLVERSEVNPPPERPDAQADSSYAQAADTDGILEAPALLRILWADPQHTPEHLALWSVKRFAGRASSAVQRIKAENPDADDGTLQRKVVEQQTRVSIVEGAFVGGPFIVVVPVAFCAALLAQAQMVLELAAVTGHAPDDQARAADILVLQSVYPSDGEARAALANAASDPRSRQGRRLPRGTRWAVIIRMAYLLGVLQSSETKTSLIRSMLQWTFLVILFLVGLVLPLVWVPYMANAMRRSASTIGERGIRFYEQREKAADVGIRIATVPTIRVSMAGTLLRTLFLVVVPVIVAVIALATGVNFGGGKLLDAGLLLIGVSALITLGWFAYRWWRRSRARTDTAQEES